MALAQLTYRESLRDIEACLQAQAAKLYHMGFREPVARSTLAGVNELRDWRIWESFAGRLIAQARELYVSEDLGLDLSNSCDHNPLSDSMTKKSFTVFDTYSVFPLHKNPHALPRHN